MSKSLDQLESLFHELRALPMTSRKAILEELEQTRPDLSLRLKNLLEVEEHAEQALASDGLTHMSVPEEIGQFRILEPLDRGGMGIVYKAEQQTPHRAVALKILRQDMLSVNSKRRFEHEVAILGRLRHPGVAQVYDAGTFETAFGAQPYFAMELVEGQNLHDYVETKGLDLRGRLELMILICEGVQHAHHNGIVHRDLKPDNIMVESNGQPRILDFGIAKSLNADLDAVTRQTNAAQVIGTLGYMSPEQIQGDQNAVDTRADIYSLGVIAYEMLCGKLPHDLEGLSLPEAIRRVHDEETTRISLHDTRFRGDVETILAKALRQDRENRYDSPSALADDFRRFLRTEPIAARPPSRTYQIKKFARRHRVLVGALVTILMSLTLGLAGMSWMNLKVQRELDERKRFSDSRLVANLDAQMEALWPRRPHIVGGITTWIGQARELVGRLPEHQESVERVQSETYQEQLEAGIVLAGGSPNWDLADPDQQFRFDTFSRLVEALDGFEAKIEEMETRREVASSIEYATVEKHEEDWEEALVSIFEDPRYEGLDFLPIVGLVPIGQDPVSKLWEFWHVETGSRPERDGSRVLDFGEDSGMVFVLIPGGEFLMGAQSQKPKRPNYLVHAQPRESPVHSVHLDPFLISKYEMTQAQWKRLTGENPSGNTRETYALNDCHPVERVSWETLSKYLTRLLMRFPTESQWEYACRGGGAEPFIHLDDDRSRLGERFNLMDQAFYRYRTSDGFVPEHFDDGYPWHAPVNTKVPNSFGLHHMIGNVSEWCLDQYLEQSYKREDPRAGDGLREFPGTGFFRAIRGGSYSDILESAHATRRLGAPTKTANSGTGIRPVIALPLE